MKISKVDNMRFAVVPSEQETGKLYRDPKRQETVTMMAHVEGRIKKASNLYSVLNRKNVPKGCKVGKNVDNFNNMLRYVAFQETTEEQLEVLQNPCNYKDKKEKPLQLGDYQKPEEQQDKKQDKKRNIQSEANDTDTVQDFARIVVHSALKKGLRKYQDIVTELFCWFCQPESYAVNVKKPEHQEQIKAFLQALYEDCWKVKQKEHICASLAQQNVRVQVTKKEDRCRLALASYCNADAKEASQKTQTGDHADKSVLFQFLREYAANPEAIQRILYQYTDIYLDIDVDSIKETSEECILPTGLPRKPANKAGVSKVDYAATREQLVVWLKQRYKAAKEKENSPEAIFWYQRMELCLEQYFANSAHLNETCLTKGNLIRIVQGYLSHYVMGKYMDLGKAVYHFCDLDTEDIHQCGTVMPHYQDFGITSFDYEYIKAEEKLEKDLAVSLVYAIQNFRQNIMQGGQEEKDILLPDAFQAQMESVSDEKLQKELLRYWGGVSSVDTELLDVDQPASGDTKKSGIVQLAEELRQSLYFLRNYSFHYGAQEQKELPHDVLQQMIQQDIQKYSVSVYQKYLNNNVFGFYEEKKVCELIQNLHKTSKYTPSFVPAFASVFKRNQMPDYMKQIGIEVQENGTGAEQFRSALYFVLKEIYYYQFLGNDGQVLCYFRQAFEEEQTRLYKKCASAEKRKDDAEKKKDAAFDKNASQEEKNLLVAEWKKCKEDWNTVKTELLAMENFQENIPLYGDDITFGQICQRAMMTYALQNNTNYRKAKVREEKETFAHYKMILTKILYQAFVLYMKENPDYAFLKEPQSVQNTNTDTEKMLKEFSAPQCHLTEYDNLVFRGNLAYACYAMGKLLPPKQLNLLVGDLKNYQQFTADIQRRSGCAGSSPKKKKVKDLGRLIKILQFCLLSSGQISKQFEDYYQDKHDYAAYLRGFVDFGDSGQNLPYSDLEEFCQSVTKSKESDSHLIYVDGRNPVLYRGIELARMFGLDGAVRNALEHRVTKEDIENLKQYIAEDLKTVLEQGECHNKEEQDALKQYQNLKQKVELNDIQTYSDLIFDLYSQLIGWCYLHERDQMYLLLGYHYVRQYWPTEEGISQYPLLQNVSNIYRYGKSVVMDGGITNQLGGALHEQFKTAKVKYRNMAEGNRLVTLPEMQSSKKKEKLAEWFGEDTLAVEALMHVGQRKIRMGNNNSFRNYVDHFEYFRKQDLSLLQLYQNAFYYMGYDRKLQHTVIRKLETILERYFLFGRIVWTASDDGAALAFAKPTLADMENAFGKLPTEEQNRSIPENAMITSKWLTYSITDSKTEKKETVVVDAHTQKFCHNVHAILTYTAEAKQN